MNILILGAGQVGSTTAKQLAKEEDNEITIVDINPDKLSKLSNTTDLRVVEGNASYPNILKAANAPRGFHALPHPLCIYFSGWFIWILLTRLLPLC